MLTCAIGSDIERENGHIVGFMPALVGIKRLSYPAPRRLGLASSRSRAVPQPRARGGEPRQRTPSRVYPALSPRTRHKVSPASSLSTKPGSSAKRASCSVGHFEADSRSASRVILRVKPYSSHAEPAKNTMPSTFAIGAKPSPMKGNASGESEPVAPAMPA